MLVSSGILAMSQNVEGIGCYATRGSALNLGLDVCKRAIARDDVDVKARAPDFGWKFLQGCSVSPAPLSRESALACLCSLLAPSDFPFTPASRASFHGNRRGP